uniref:Uncharacterized protein n=1 Tax=Cacopsylla melanoneura TaxID=428564 RepID=A0A8D8T092_9HEMI
MEHALTSVVQNYEKQSRYNKYDELNRAKHTKWDKILTSMMYKVSLRIVFKFLLKICSTFIKYLLKIICTYMWFNTTRAQNLSHSCSLYKFHTQKKGKPLHTQVSLRTRK